jgi:hypothetical protein
VKLSRDTATDRPFRVVFMGRTMAGKSTLFEFFAGGDGARVGDGRQRATTDTCLRPSGSLGFEIVDTPGVGAMDGEDDYTTAFTQVADADLVLWVGTDQATQELTGVALRQLGALGKPIIVALNCLTDLEDEIGWLDVTESPERVFGGHTEGNLAPINRHLAKVGASTSRAVLIHAQAALHSAGHRHDESTSQLLRTNSRIDELLSALAKERDRSAPQRRILSICDRLRIEVLNAAAFAETIRGDLMTRSAAWRGGQRDFRRRASRRIDDAREQLLAAMTDSLGRRDRWYETVDIEANISTLWAVEAKQMQDEITAAGKAVGEQLFADLEELSADTADDWASFESGTFDDLTGFGAVWGNRAVKVGGKLAIAVGAGELGFALGSIVPGVGNVVGGVAGFAIGVGVAVLLEPVGKLLDGLANWFFRSKADVIRRRRAQVREQLRPVMHEIRSTLSINVDSLVASWRSAVDSELAKQSCIVDEIDGAIVEIEHASCVLKAALREIDTETARALLKLNARSRAAQALVRATRWQGVGLVVELPEPALTELFLFPAEDAVETIVPVAQPSAFASASSLQVVVGLCSGEVTVSKMTSEQLDVSLSEPTPDGVRESWAALAFAHSGVRPTIAQGGRR